MMVAAAARRQLSVVGINLWQTGVRSLFRYFIFRSKLTQDEAWAAVRVELVERCPLSEEWEYQEIRAILYEEENVTLEIAESMYRRFPDSTPLIDAIRACLQALEVKAVDKGE